MMKFKFRTIIAKKYFRILSQTLPTITYKPELEGIYLEIFDNKIIFYIRNDYFDLKIIEANTNNFQIEKIGTILIKGKTINEIIQKIDSEWIEFELKDNSLIIKDQHSKYKLNLLNNQNYDLPSFEINGTTKLTIPALQFKTLISKILSSANENIARKVFQGINLKLKNNHLAAMSTDTIRISYSEILLQQETLNDFEKIIPIKILKELLKIFVDQQLLNFNFAENKFIVTGDNIIIKGQVIEGFFPEILNAFPIDKKITLRINKDEIRELINKITISSINSNLQLNNIKLTLKDNLQLETNYELGHARISSTNFELITANNELKEQFEIVINPKYLLDAIKNIETSQVQMILNESNLPIIISAASQDSYNYKNLILPYKY